MSRVSAIVLAVLVAAALGALAVSAQQPPAMPMPHGGPPPGGMPHGPMPHGPMPHGGGPGQPGQDAFGAIAEVVRLLDADPATDWTKVDLERLRQHLIDMNEVVLHAEVKQVPVAGGLTMDVTGAGRTERAIKAMVVAHAAELDRLPGYAAKAEPIAGGVRLTVTARDAADARAVDRVRGLGFVGLLTEGAHHGPHHLALARGEAHAHTP